MQLFDLLFELLGVAADRLGFVEHQQAIRGQVVDQRGCAEKPAIKLEGGEGVATLAQHPQVAGECVDELGTQGVQVERDAQCARQHLVGRSDCRGFELLGRALRGGVEQADGVDFIAPQLDAQRLAPWRKDVQDAAAPAEQAG